MNKQENQPISPEISDKSHEESQIIEQEKTGLFKSLNKRARRIAGGMLLVSGLSLATYEGENISIFLHKITAGINEYDAKLEKERTHEGIGEIVRKEHIPSGLMGIMIGKYPGAIPTPEHWQVEIKTQEGNGIIDVDKNQYDSYNIGDSIKVKYELNSSIMRYPIAITSIEK